MRQLVQVVWFAILLADFLPLRARAPLTQFNRDPRNRIVNQIDTSGATAPVASHGFDLAGCERRTNCAAGADFLQYDSGPGYEATGYDPAGNRRGRSRLASSTRYPNSVYGTSASTSQAYDQNDRLDNDTTAATPSTLFDGNGNTKSHGGVSYDYDFENRLLTASTGPVTLTYDGNGNRVKKVSPSGTVYYLIDDRNPTGYAQVLEEQPATPGAAPEVTYLYGLQRASQTRLTGTTGTYYYGYDGLGSVRHLTTKAVSGFTDGSVSDAYNYDAFGVKLPSSTDSTTNNYGFAGEHWDPDLGMYYNRARFYHPDLGRFWSMDTFEGSPSDPLSLHKYLYAHNNPVMNTDPSGHETLPSLMTGFTIRAIGFRMLIGSAVGVWDANFRGYSQWEGLAWGAVGGAVGPLIPWQLGVTLTAYGIGEALEDGDYDSALFRGATAVIGAGSFRWAKSLPGGRLGNMNTQLQNTKIAAYLQMRGWKIRAGGGRGAEERIPPPGGGRNGETWVDITVEKNVGGTVRTLRIQTVDTLANGAPTPRELNAASRIRAAFPADKLILVPKADAGAKLPTLPLFRGPGDEEEQ